MRRTRIGRTCWTTSSPPTPASRSWITPGIVALPAAVTGRDAVSDALVRRFNQTYENIYSFYLHRPCDTAATFDCGWLVFMTDKADRSVRAGAGRYAWRFTADEPPLADALTITIETMLRLDGAAWQVVQPWLEALAYPWTTPGDAVAAAPDAAELEPLRRCLDALAASTITPKQEVAMNPRVVRTPSPRRAVLQASLAALAGAATTGSRAQDAASRPARTRGPAVWLDMDQAELDDAYDQSKYAPNFQQMLRRFALNSERARQRLGPPRRVTYGTSAIEALDIYATTSANAPIQVFLHGGAWRFGLARDYAFAAELFVKAGAHLVVPDFTWVQDAGGNLMTMAEQVRRAIVWVHRNAASFGGDPGRIFLSGHSSGAHLAAVALTTDWRSTYDLPPDLLKGGLCCSGPYDLKAVRLSARNSYVKFTDEIEAALSATRQCSGSTPRSSSRTARSKRRSSSVSAASSPPRRGGPASRCS